MLNRLVPGFGTLIYLYYFCQFGSWVVNLFAFCARCMSFFLYFVLCNNWLMHMSRFLLIFEVTQKPTDVRKILELCWKFDLKYGQPQLEVCACS